MSEEVGAKRWYAVHTYSGYENKVKKNLEKRVESMNMTEQIFRVVIPEEEETQVKDGKAKTTVKKTFPGYVLVELIMTDESWYVVRNTPGVTGFVGSAGAGSKPNPLLPEEVRFILNKWVLKKRLSMLNSKLASKFVLNQVHLRIKLVKFKKLKQISLS